MKRIETVLKAGLAGLSLMGAMGLVATAALAADDDLEMLAKLKKLYPATRISTVAASPIVGLWEVRMGEQVAYTDAQGRHFLFGSVMDMQTQKDLTAERRPAAAMPSQAPRAAFPAEHLNQAIKTVRGDGSRVLAVFSDPLCPYCKALEQELAKLSNVTIYTFLYPILAQDSKSRAVSVWCSGDRQKSWQDSMLGSRVPRLTACPNPINENLLLGSRLGIQATPAMVSADGRLWVGATSAAQIEGWLADKLAARTGEAK